MIGNYKLNNIKKNNLDFNENNTYTNIKKIYSDKYKKIEIYKSGILFAEEKYIFKNIVKDRLERFYEEFNVLYEPNFSFKKAEKYVKKRVINDLKTKQSTKQNLINYYKNQYNIIINTIIPEQIIWDEKFKKWVIDEYYYKSINNHNNYNIWYVLYADIEIQDDIQNYLKPILHDMFQYNEIINHLVNYYKANILEIDVDYLLKRFHDDIYELYLTHVVIKTHEVINITPFVYFIGNFKNNIMTKDDFKKCLISKLNNIYIPKVNYLIENYYHPDINTVLIGDKNIDQWFAIYMILKFKKYEIDQKHNNLNINPYDRDKEIPPIEINIDQTATNSFDIKYNKKYYGLHHVGFPGTYQLDLMYSKTLNNCYMVAIEVNTRYLFLTRTNIAIGETGNEKIEQKSILALYLALERLVDQGWKPSIVKADSEPALLSNFIQNIFFKRRGIRFQSVFRTTNIDGSTSPMHTSLAIVDRVIKTIKQKFLNRGYINGQLPMEEVYKFVVYYNNKKHKTLSSILKKDTTPTQVHNDMKLEIEIIKDRIKRNREIKKRIGWLIPKNTEVKVYDNEDKLNKNRITRIDKYVVDGNIGNIYKIKNKRTGITELISRIKIAKD